MIRAQSKTAYNTSTANRPDLLPELNEYMFLRKKERDMKKPSPHPVQVGWSPERDLRSEVALWEMAPDTHIHTPLIHSAPEME